MVELGRVASPSCNWDVSTGLPATTNNEKRQTRKLDIKN